MSESDKPQNQNPPSSQTDFEPVTLRDEAERLLREALRARAPGLIWTAKKELRIRVTASPRSDEKLFWVQCESAETALSIQTALHESGVQEVFFSMPSAQSNILFKTPYDGLEDDQLRFLKPLKMFKVQRRKDARLNIREGYVLRVNFNHSVKGPMSEKALDISVGGLSLMIDADDELFFRPGTLLSELTFIVQAKRIYADGEVRYARPHPLKPGVLKVGIQFTRIHEESTQVIDKYVFEETMKVMARLL